MNKAISMLFGASLIVAATLMISLGKTSAQDKETPKEKAKCDCEKVEIVLPKTPKEMPSAFDQDPNDKTANKASADIDLHFKILCHKEEKPNDFSPCEDEVQVEEGKADWSKSSGAQAKNGPNAGSEKLKLDPSTLKGKKCNGELNDLATDASGKKQSFTLHWSADFPKGNDVKGTIPIELKTKNCAKKSTWTVTLEFEGTTSGPHSTATVTIKEKK